MPINLSGRPFLRLLDFSTEEIEYLLKLSKNDNVQSLAHFHSSIA